MFLSTFENRIDKKGRVAVPASFRSYLSNLGYNGIFCYPSFNNPSTIISKKLFNNLDREYLEISFEIYTKAISSNNQYNLLLNNNPFC